MDKKEIKKNISRFIQGNKIKRESQPYLKKCKSAYNEIIDILAHYQDE
jgi:hypothetical protein